ncbi:MAG: esterase-like activity of phytase family protein [Thermoanaerobaculales bacterium]
MRLGIGPKSLLFLALAFAVPGFAGLEIEFLGETVLPGDLRVGDTLVGGLSGLTYDPGCDLYYTVSDDRGRIDPPRFYTIRILNPGDSPRVEVLGVTLLRDRDGAGFKPGELDAEALALAPSGALYLSSEGIPHRGIPPFVRRIALDGSFVGDLPLPGHFLADSDGGQGVRDNLGFEGLGLTPDGAHLFAAAESALLQDGPVAEIGIESAARVVVFDLESGLPEAEYVYPIDAVPDQPQPADAFRMNGISEILVLDVRHILVVERSFSAGVGNRVRLFLADFDGATNVLERGRLGDTGGEPVRPMTKTLVADLGDFGLTLDNIEGAALGPVLADGRRMLVMVSDNNFQPSVQRNQVLFFAVSGVPPPQGGWPVATIHEIQGAGHVSPLVGRCISGVHGVVTAILGDRGGQAFWVQDPEEDGDPATSEGVLVTALPGLPEVAPGYLVVLAGRVEEPSWGIELPVTRFRAEKLEIVGRDHALPKPTSIGAKGRSIPRALVASPRLESFDPDTHAADFFESLEGMRVRLDRPSVVGPTSSHGEVVVLADEGLGSAPRTARGGVLSHAGAVNLERVVIDDRLMPDQPDLIVGDNFDGPIEGILHYSFGAYKVLNTSPLPAVDPSGLEPEETELESDGSRLTVATFNLENLSAQSPPEKFARLGRIVAKNLRSPAILAVQEVQDDSGPDDDGVVSAGRTLGLLVKAIVSAGGVRYETRSINPEDGRDGGQPGANIRTAFLIDPARVEFVDRTGSSEGREVGLAAGPLLGRSPGLIAPDDRAFGGGDGRRSGSRKPLAGEFLFAGRRFFVVNLHLASKFGDDPVFGRRQPRLTESTARRAAQARVLAEFVTGLLAEDPEARLIVLGDLNDHDGSIPLRTLESAGLEDLVERLPVAERYSYIYLGNSELLDHILVSKALAGGAEVDIVHVSSEFPADGRSSDHDPVVASLEF